MLLNPHPPSPRHTPRSSPEMPPYSHCQLISSSDGWVQKWYTCTSTSHLLWRPQYPHVCVCCASGEAICGSYISWERKPTGNNSLFPTTCRMLKPQGLSFSSTLSVTDWMLGGLCIPKGGCSFSLGGLLPFNLSPLSGGTSSIATVLLEQMVDRQINY